MQNPKYAASSRRRAPASASPPSSSPPMRRRSVALLVTPAPYRAFVAVAQKLFPGALRPSSLFEASGVSAGALVHPSARLEAGVVDRSRRRSSGRAPKSAPARSSAPTAVIGPDVRIGRDCAIGAGATIVHALIGDRVIIHAGARIGQDGFGYLPGAARPRQGAAGRPRHHPGRRRDRRQYDDRPRRDPRHRDRRGHQDRQPRPDRAQRRDRAALRDRGAYRDFRQRARSETLS